MSSVITNGIIALTIGTAAAGIQATMGGAVAAGGWFAAAQSVAMGGTLPVIGTTIAAGVSGIGTAVAARWW